MTSAASTSISVKPRGCAAACSAGSARGRFIGLARGDACRPRLPATRRTLVGALARRAVSRTARGRPTPAPRPAATSVWLRPSALARGLQHHVARLDPRARGRRRPAGSRSRSSGSSDTVHPALGTRVVAQEVVAARVDAQADVASLQHGFFARLAEHGLRAARLPGPSRGRRPSTLIETTAMLVMMPMMTTTTSTSSSVKPEARRPARSAPETTTRCSSCRCRHLDPRRPAGRRRPGCRGRSHRGCPGRGRCIRCPRGPS